MKQYITEKQLNELSDIDRDKLFYWYRNIDSCDYNRVNPLLSIGQMIEFLTENQFDVPIFKIERIPEEYCVEYSKNYEDFCSYIETELCDALWEAVKEAL